MDDDQTFLFLLATLWFAQALWVLFDASETKKRLPVALAWGLGCLVLPVIGMIGYLLKKQDDVAKPVGNIVMRQYWFTVSFTFLAMLFVGVAQTGSSVLQMVLENTPDRSLGVREDLAWSLAVVTIALPAWLFHYIRARSYLRNLVSDHEFQATFLIRKTMLVVTMGISGFLVIGILFFYVFAFFRTLLGVSNVPAAEYGGPIAWLATASFTLAFAYLFVYRGAEYKALANRFLQVEDAPGEPEVESSSAEGNTTHTSVCGSCKLSVDPSDKFCGAHGVPIGESPCLFK